MAAIVCSMSVNAQTMKVMKGDKVVATYTAEQADKVVFEEATAPTKSNLLSGKFTVAEGKTVQFTRSNLYWDGNDYKFEANQTDYPTSWDANHVGHFFWSSTAAVAYAQSYSDGSASTSDKFFCGEDNKITVEGTEGLYALSSDEWTYLVNSRTNARSLYKYGVTVAGKSNCLIIAPDGYTGTIAASYDATAWAAAEALGLVCLPAAGYRSGSNLDCGGYYGYYWSSSPYAFHASHAYYLYFYSDDFGPASSNYRFGYSLRLVK